ncbi:TPA: flippase, partial [Klebsiella pneumoniae]|nr:flippase [Klebsiella pneumoniae]
FFPPVCISLWLLNSNLFQLIKTIFPIVISTLIMIIALNMALSIGMVNPKSVLELFFCSLFGAVVYFLTLSVFSKKIREIFLKKLRFKKVGI